GALDPLLHPTEDPGDPIRLGQEGRVADGEGRAQPQAPQRAHPGGGLCDEDEGHAVAHEDPGQQDVAQLSSRGLHDGRVVVLHKDSDNEEGGDKTQARDSDGTNGPDIFPADVLLGQLVAAIQGLVGPVTKTAVHAGELIQQGSLHWDTGMEVSAQGMRLVSSMSPSAQ
ncbi:hypothetical protein DV515_00009680, partial [Chloebia gouldiae]